MYKDKNKQSKLTKKIKGNIKKIVAKQTRKWGDGISFTLSCNHLWMTQVVLSKGQTTPLSRCPYPNPLPHPNIVRIERSPLVCE